jgi:glycosyltransferase involved in cell wall biosynthesis
VSGVLLAATRSVAGGAQRALAALAGELVARGWSVEGVLAEPGWLADELIRHGVAVRVGVEPTLEPVRHHVLLSLGASGHAWAGPAAAASGVPACWWLELGWRDRPVERAAIAVPARAIAVPTLAAAAALSTVCDVPTTVIAPGVEPGDVVARAAAARRSRPIAAEAHLVVLVGRIDPIKGQDVAIEALARLRSEGRAVHLAIVGGAIVGHEGDLEARLRARSSELGVDRHLTWTGHLDDPGPWHAAAEISLNASLHEAFGLGVVEALAHAKPVVATRTDGPTEILGDGRYGVLVEPGDPVALAAAIGSLLDDAATLDRLRSLGPARAAAFSPGVAAERWDGLLASVLRGGCGSGD